MRLTTIAAKFLKIGATGFGGPMALIGLMHRDLVEKSDVPEETFTEGMALGQMLPGPAAVSCGTYLGFRLRGLIGAITSTGGLILPSFLLMLTLSPLYLKYGEVPQVGGFFKGVGPAVVAVILAAGLRMGRKFAATWQGALIAAVVLALSLLKAHPALLVIAGGLMGLLLAPESASPPRQAPAAEQEAKP